MEVTLLLPGAQASEEESRSFTQQVCGSQASAGDLARVGEAAPTPGLLSSAGLSALGQEP